MKEMSGKAVIVNAGREDYGIPIHYVISIEKPEAITPIPHLPSYMKGIVKARGQLIPVLGFSDILYGQECQMDAESRLIVLKTEELSYGLFVQEAKEITEIPAESLNQVGIAAYEKTKYFSAVASLEDRLITMLDPDCLAGTLEGIKEIKDYMLEQNAQHA